MSHPPIPKCKWFVKTDGGTWALTYRDATGCIDDFINIEPIEELGWIPDASIRYFAACVAEVEWMKRAERWEDVKNEALRIRYRWAGKPNWTFVGEERFKVAYLMTVIVRCKENAQAWREWGEQS